MAKKIKKSQSSMKPEVVNIFNELDEYLDYCRFTLSKYDPADLFKPGPWQKFNEKRKRKAAYEAREAKRQAKRKAEQQQK